MTAQVSVSSAQERRGKRFSLRCTVAPTAIDGHMKPAQYKAIMPCRNNQTFCACAPGCLLVTSRNYNVNFESLSPLFGDVLLVTRVDEGRKN